MTRRIFLLVCGAALLPSAVSAQVVLSEIMYDLETGSDSGREWVEVFNSSGGSVNLTEWKLFENAVNHSISAYSGSETLSSGGYAIIADNPANFLADNPSFSGALFDSAFSLSNTGETLIMRCCGSDLLDKDSVTYASTMGATGDGKTLQRTVVGGSFSPLAPTPGSGTLSADTNTPTETTFSEETGDTGPNAGAGGGTLSGAKPPPPPVPLYANAGADSSAPVGARVWFLGEAYDAKKVILEDVHFLWNFGDGSSGEGKALDHVYEYPGTYVVLLTVTKYERTASDQRIVTVEEPRASLKVFDDGSVSIVNAGTRSLDVSFWKLVEYGHVFTFPKGTSIMSNTSLRISPKRLGFHASSQVALEFPDGGHAASVAVVPELLVEEEPPARPPTQYVSSPRVAPTIERELPDEDVSATSSAYVGSVAASGAGGFVSPWFVSALLLGIVGAGVVIAVRRLQAGEWTIIEETDEKSV